MKRFIYSLVIIALFFSCEKYPDPGTETLERFDFGIHGNNQSNIGDNYLPLEIGAQVDMNSLMPKTNKKFSLEIEITSGGGSIDNSTIEADSEGKMLTKWKLGNNRNKQILSCQIFDSTDKFYSEFTIEATAFFEDHLNEISSGYLVGIQDMVRDTVNQKSMMLSGSTIYTCNSEKLFDWQPVYNPYKIYQLEINSIGHVYAAGRNGELFRTRNWGVSWEQLGTPIPENKYHYELTITKDDYIWANKWEHGIYCSKDGGITFSKDTLGLTKQEELGRIYSFSDTSHMAISHANTTILQSSDEGLSWQPINTPEYSLSMFITDDNAIIAQNQNGFQLHKSTDGGKTYKKVFTANVAFGTSSKHCYDKFKNDYYVLAPGGGVWKTKDFESFKELMTFRKQRNLFIDHNGTIYASGFNYSNAEAEPTYVLPYK